ncbi:MAG TPA: hypothetical protein VFF52_23170 [Isosphaeraceae bacterium]|nr:hypothetical protein [Isosphaeraceae bacterium]
MTRIARAVVIGLLLTAVLGTSGCGWSRGLIHTWAETYADFPPEINSPHPAPPQGNPSDG